MGDGARQGGLHWIAAPGASEDVLESRRTVSRRGERGETRTEGGLVRRELSVAAVADARGRAFEVEDALAVDNRRGTLLARDMKCRRRVEISVLLAEDGEGSAETVAFLRQAQLAGQLEHPNILPVHDLGVDDAGNAFVVQRVAPRVSLATVLEALRRGDPAWLAAYPLGRLVTVFQKCCDAVAFAHSRQVLHGALTAESVLIGEYGEVLVAGWESAREVRRPEALGADVSGLGGILYHLLALRPLAAAGTTTASFGEKGSAAPGHWPGGRLPQSLAAVAMKALAARPLERYGSARALQLDVEAWQRGFPTNAEAAGIVRSLVLWARRRPTETAMVAAFAVVAAVMGVVFLATLSRAKMVALEKEAEARALLAEAVESQHVTRGMEEASAALALARAERLMEDGNWEAAARVARDAAERDSGSGTAAGRLFLTQARRSYRDGKWEAAAALVSEAILLDQAETLAEARLLQGRLLLGAFRVTEALAAFREARKIDPKGVGRQVLRLSLPAAEFMQQTMGQGDRPSHRQLLELSELVRQRGEELVAAQMVAGVAASDPPAGVLVELTRQRLCLANPQQRGLAFVSAAGPDGLNLDLSGNGQLADISALRGLDLAVLSLAETVVSDLGPLSGAGLRELDLSGSRVADLSVVGRMAGLRALALRGCPVSDLSPLRGLQLVRLELAQTRVTDLSPLRGMPLLRLGLAGLEVAGLEPLAGAPLEVLDLTGAVTEDVRVLLACERLRQVWGTELPDPLADMVGRGTYEEARRQTMEQLNALADGHGPWFGVVRQGLRARLDGVAWGWLEHYLDRGEMDRVAAVAGQLAETCAGRACRAEMALWAARALALSGDRERAREWVERVLADASEAPAFGVWGRFEMARLAALEGEAALAGRLTELLDFAPELPIPSAAVALSAGLGDERLAAAIRARVAPPGCVVLLDFADGGETAWRKMELSGKATVVLPSESGLVRGGVLHFGGVVESPLTVTGPELRRRRRALAFRVWLDQLPPVLTRLCGWRGGVAGVFVGPEGRVWYRRQGGRPTPRTEELVDTGIQLRRKDWAHVVLTLVPDGMQSMMDCYRNGSWVSQHRVREGHGWSDTFVVGGSGPVSGRLDDLMIGRELGPEQAAALRYRPLPR